MLPVGIICLDMNCRTNKDQQTNATKSSYILHFLPLPSHPKRNYTKQTTP